MKKMQKLTMTKGERRIFIGYFLVEYRAEDIEEIAASETLWKVDTKLVSVSEFPALEGCPE